jgi:signal transduction histidine kinase
VATLDRAIAFCEATLAYGRAAERLPHRQMMQLKPVIMDLANLTDLAPERGIVFRTDVPDTLMIDADEDQLSRVLVNLVRNAVQALSQVGTRDGTPEIDVSAERKGREVVICVRDNGPGSPDRLRADLFTPVQVSNRKGGTGLGLTIVAEIVRLHGGTITLDEGAAGTCFRLTIPDRQSDGGALWAN